MPDSENPSKSRSGRKLVLWAWALSVSIVFMIVLLFVVQPRESFHARLKESVLKIDLETMRHAIDNYTLDKQKLPQSLQELVDANYLRAIPVDPMTERRDWIVEFAEMRLSPGTAAEGISDVHSNSQKVSLGGTGYDTW